MDDRNTWREREREREGERERLFPCFYSVGTRPCNFVGVQGEGNGHAVSKDTMGTLLATFTDPFNSTIYNHSLITMRTATTKIPHLLYEKDLLKAPNGMCYFIY